MAACKFFYATVLVLAVCASVTRAEDRRASWQPVVRDAASEESASLTAAQNTLVQRVNAYFNQITMLEGRFLQTGADGKQLHGVLHIQRPGRFRFEFAPPTRVVVVSDGTAMNILDYNLNTDDRQDLRQIPFRALFLPKVDLVRDTELKEVRENDGVLTVKFQDHAAEAGSVTLFLTSYPFQLKGWLVRDVQNLETRVELTDLKVVDRIEPRLFDHSARLERRW